MPENGRRRSAAKRKKLKPPKELLQMDETIDDSDTVVGDVNDQDRSFIPSSGSDDVSDVATNAKRSTKKKSSGKAASKPVSKEKTNKTNEIGKETVSTAIAPNANAGPTITIEESSQMHTKAQSAGHRSLLPQPLPQVCQRRPPPKVRFRKPKQHPNFTNFRNPCQNHSLGMRRPKGLSGRIWNLQMFRSRLNQSKGLHSRRRWMIYVKS